ncbi:MAG: Gfo/Idh/MocA family oxidoreductase [Tannerellaceae bacterium]|jgi:predicted dehydrogenase|nr:Gfo/Idh/MocA family oxidoreductase [Tannerellaceae bacterium]
MNKNQSKHNLSRRSFFKKSALGMAGTTLSMPFLVNGCSGVKSNSEESKWKNVFIPELLPKAPDGNPLKAGLIGCGSRGTGAACNFLDAGNDLKITALGDIFPDKLSACRKVLEQKGQNIPDEHCFLGFDAYRKVIDSGVDIVLMCTPPVFRPMHFEYAIGKSKHCFIEKPCAVDPVGVRKILVAGKRATQMGLSVMSGTCLRSEKDYIETYRRVAGGAIGDIVSAHVSRMGTALWYIRRRPEWNDMEYMLRNWANFCWTSGDHIVEQFIHEIDVMSWFTGEKHPVRAEATGGRQRRITGDMYDNFSVEYVYEDGHRALCTTRQIDGCDTATAVMVYGTKGFTDCAGTIYNLDGSVAWKYPYPAEGAADQSMAVPDPFVQEHIRLVTAIRSNQPFNDTEQHAQSTLMAIMGREAAYTGKFVTWDQIMVSTLELGPKTYEFGPVPGGVKEEIPLAGTPPQISNT